MNDHPHHWKIEPANGPTSIGVCQVCRATRSFNNAIDDIDYRKVSRRTQKQLEAVRKAAAEENRYWGVQDA